MTVEFATDEVSIKGKQVRIPGIKIEEFTVLVFGKFLKIAAVKDETWLSKEITDPAGMLEILRKSKLKADIFTFSQRIPDYTPRFKHYFEMDNFAAIPIDTYDKWWKGQINDKTRNMARKAGKKGALIKSVDFNDELVNGIMGIYNETPIRLGRPFWHYGKGFEVVKKENSTYIDRADFIGAFLGNELIGFLKMVYTGKTAIIMQILTKIAHRDKSPANALLAKAVETCANKSVPYLIYSNFVYGKKGEDSLTDFKKHNGFIQVNLPKYYVPLSLKGWVSIKLGFHHFPYNLMPRWLLGFLLAFRSRLLSRSI